MLLVHSATETVECPEANGLHSHRCRIAVDNELRKCVLQIRKKRLGVMSPLIETARFQPGNRFLHLTCDATKLSAAILPRVLCVACSSQVFTKLDQTLGGSGLHVLSAATRDRGVAICVAEAISLTVLDAESIRGEDCSLATALKMVRPGMPIIRIEERERLSPIPDNIDAVVPFGATEALVRKIGELLNLKATDFSAAG